jgi:hypothetical protein
VYVEVACFLCPNCIIVCKFGVQQRVHSCVEEGSSEPKAVTLKGLCADAVLLGLPGGLGCQPQGLRGLYGSLVVLLSKLHDCMRVLCAAACAFVCCAYSAAGVEGSSESSTVKPLGRSSTPAALGTQKGGAVWPARWDVCQA